MRRTKAQNSFIMTQVRAKGSKLEVFFEKCLKKNRIKFVKQYNIVGRPDFVLLSKKIAVFCDSHFWHGYQWRIKKKEHKSNKRFWHSKIEANMARDKKVNRLLKKEGWKVIRFWEHQVLKTPELCISRIRNAIENS